MKKAFFRTHFFVLSYQLWNPSSFTVNGAITSVLRHVAVKTMPIYRYGIETRARMIAEKTEFWNLSG